jgi:glucose/arabinose dehydrogenase
MAAVRISALFILAWLMLVACRQPETEEVILHLTDTPPAGAGEASAAPDEATGAPEQTVSPEPSETPAPTETAVPGPTATSPPSPTPTRAPERISSVRLVQVAGGFTRPTHVNHAQDRRLFVVEQAGTIRIVNGDELLALPFLDVTDRVGSGALEQGLLSVAFHPAYPQNGRFFVYYTDRAGAVVVSEFAVSSDDPDRADPGGERIVLRVSQPYANHNGGQLQFGPDGMLYIGLGDGGSAGDPGGHGQNPGTLLGSILRIDVDGSEPYGIPEDNPLVGQAGYRPETWVYGLRNPWRFSFDRLTDALYIADVGQNLLEEVNYQPAGSPGGENYGWNILEASACYASQDCDPSGTVLPVSEYPHAGRHCSITGGHVYRGSEFTELWGNYFFGDYCSGVVWSLIRLPDGDWLTTQLLESEYRISSFGEDVDGELYAVEQGSGLLLRLEP